MDTKKLYLKSRKTVLNWGMAMSSVFFVLVIISIFTRKLFPEARNDQLNFWVNLVAYTVIFVAMLITKIKHSIRSAKIAFYCNLAIGVFYMFNLAYTLTQDKALLKQPLIIFLAILVTSLITIGLCLLFYHVYKAIKHINYIKNEI